MNTKLFLLITFICLAGFSSSKVIGGGGKHSKLSQTDLDKEVLLDDDDYPDDDPLDLPEEEQKEKLKSLVEKKIDTNHDGMIDNDELFDWTLKAYDRFEVDDLKEEMQIVDESKDDAIQWKEHVTDAFGSECAEQDADGEKCFSNAESEEDKQNAINYQKDRLLFNAADANGDEELDFDEFVLFKHPRRSEKTSRVVIDQKIDQLDKDGDKQLTMEEFLQETKDQTTDENTWKLEEERFRDELDTDGNEKLDEAEILNWVEPSNVEEAKDESEHLMNECDQNNDDKLTVEEILENHSLWVDSDATDYGRYLLEHDEL